ncbi:MAG: hypothetical protein R3F42_14440 [Pseudomonadota bacterium]
MYFDNLTLVSLVVFLIAFGAFIYSCLFRNCISGSARDDWHEDTNRDEDRG